MVHKRAFVRSIVHACVWLRAHLRSRLADGGAHRRRGTKALLERGAGPVQKGKSASRGVEMSTHGIT
jgi:hypothetical protein